METKIAVFKERTDALRIITDVKYMDFFFLTEEYNAKTTLTAEERTQLAMRVHDFANPVKDVFLRYLTKSDVLVYHMMQLKLQKIVLNMKISLEKNNLLNAQFLAYWNFIISVLKKDAEMIMDKKLDAVILHFEDGLATLTP